MGFNFANVFGSGSGIAHNGPAPATATPVAASSTAAASSTTNGNPQSGDQSGAAAKSSPLDSLQAFWDTPKDAEGKPLAAPVDPTAQPIYNFDPTKVAQSAKNLDFTTGIAPELVTKALGGDSASFMDILNTVTQNAFAAGTLNTGRLINDGVATNNTRFTQVLPTHIKRVQLDQTDTTNPILSHPAAQPLVEALKNTAFARNPNASPAEVTKQVEALLVGLGVAMAEATPDAQKAKATAAAAEQDWSSFLK